jgi:endonuclease/exonuclease/phosphatase family metal-dependent hydrolase
MQTRNYQQDMEVVMGANPRRRRFLLLLATLLGLSFSLWGCADSHRPANPPASEVYLFCFWNVENLFDDLEDDRLQGADREFDRWFATDSAALKLKLAHLSEALVEMNGHRGPDIIALAEVESQRAAELLRDALNSRLSDSSLHYSHVLFKDPKGGRHIATAIISRLPVKEDRTRLHGQRLRILEGHIDVNGHDLVVLATHWTSRLTDKTGAQRAKYANQIFGVFNAMYHSNPQVDFLIAGDFNDPPDAPSVTEHLHATSEINGVRSGGKPLLLDLFGGPAFNHLGTLYGEGHWSIFDHIVVSPGLLDNKGWSCDQASAQIVTSLYRPGDKRHQPWRFGNSHAKDHGYSDHFPVAVRLKVEGN